MHSLHIIRCFKTKTKSLGFLERGKPSTSKKFLTNFSSSFTAILKLLSYSLKTKPDKSNAVSISIFFKLSFSNLIFFF